MHVIEPRESWTDERLDKLSRTVDEGFERVDTDVRELRTEMRRFRTELNGRVDGLQRSQYAGVIAIVAALIATRAF